MGPEFVFLLTMVAIEPTRVDTTYMMQYADQRMQLSQQVDALVKRNFTQQQLAYTGYAGALVDIATNRRVTLRWQF